MPSSPGRPTPGPFRCATTPLRRKGTRRVQRGEPLLRKSCFIIASVAAGLLATGARAGEAAATPASTVTLARHFTTDALDGPFAAQDWYTLLRGAFAHDVTHEFGATRIAAELEMRQFDIWDIEDDMALGMSVQTAVQPTDRLELRGTISLKALHQGDDLAAGDLVIGTTTRNASVSAGIQAGIKLATHTVLALEASAGREFSGDTRFEGNAALPMRLEPDRERLRLAALLTTTHGKFSYGVSGEAAFLRASATALLPDIVFANHAARLHAALALTNGLTITAAAGAQTLHLIDTGYLEVRPVVELVASMTLPKGFSLRGSLRTGYDTVVTDDPIASWVRRAEIEGGYQHGPRLRISAGLLAEQRKNLGLGYGEVASGMFGSAAWKASDRLELVFRLDAARRHAPQISDQRRSVATQVALVARL